MTNTCLLDELNLKIDKLQNKILQEIDGIKYILEINGLKVPDVPVQNENPISHYREFNDSVRNVKSTELTAPIPLLKSGENVSPRTEEILMYNDTIIDSSEGNKYFYYWKIQNVHELLVKSNMYRSSPDFHILGLLIFLCDQQFLPFFFIFRSYSSHTVLSELFGFRSLCYSVKIKQCWVHKETQIYYLESVRSWSRSCFGNIVWYEDGGENS